MSAQQASYEFTVPSTCPVLAELWPRRVAYPVKRLEDLDIEWPGGRNTFQVFIDSNTDLDRLTGMHTESIEGTITHGSYRVEPMGVWDLRCMAGIYELNLKPEDAELLVFRGPRLDTDLWSASSRLFTELTIRPRTVS